MDQKTAMEAAFDKAAEKKKAKNGQEEEAGVELAKEIIAMSSEEMAVFAAVATARKKKAQKTALAIAEIGEALEKIYNVPDWEYSALKENAAELVRQLKALGDGDDVRFALLVHRVKSSPPIRAMVISFLSEMNKIGRGKLKNLTEVLNEFAGKLPANSVRFEDLVLLAIPSAEKPNGEQSNADHYLFEALRRLIQKTAKAADERKFKELSAAQATDNLTYFLDGQVATYRLLKPEEVRSDGRKYRAGVLIFQLVFNDLQGWKQVKVVSAAGSLKHLEEIGGYWIRFQHLKDLWKAYADRKRNPGHFEEMLSRQRIPRDVGPEDEESYRYAMRRLVEELYFATAELRRARYHLQERGGAASTAVASATVTTAAPEPEAKVAAVVPAKLPPKKSAKKGRRQGRCRG